MARTKQTARKSTGGRARASRALHSAASGGTKAKKSYTAPSGRLGPDVKGSFVVTSRQYWEPDGFHSYQGPGETKVQSTHRSRDAAFKAARNLFWFKNPWGLSASELDDCNAEVEEHECDNGLSLVIRPPDSQVWEVDVKMIEESHRRPKKSLNKAKPQVSDDFPDSKSGEDPPALPKRKKAVKSTPLLKKESAAETSPTRADLVERPPPLPRRDCPCGAGPCTARISKSNANPGRQYFKCPMPPVSPYLYDAITDSEIEPSILDNEYKIKPSPLRAARHTILPMQMLDHPELVQLSQVSQRILKALCAPQGQQCKFFQWIDEAALGSSAGASGSRTLVSSAAAPGNVCFRCKGTGHWARDCPSRAAALHGWEAHQRYDHYYEEGDEGGPGSSSDGFDDLYPF